MNSDFGSGSNGLTLAFGLVSALVVGRELRSRSGSRDARFPAQVSPSLGAGQRVGLGIVLVAGAAGMAAWASNVTPRVAREPSRVPVQGASVSLPPGVIAKAGVVSLPPGVIAKAGVVWSDAALHFIRRFRQNVPSEVTILVNSATRTPETQASAMVAKYQYAEARGPGNGAVDIRKTYGSKAEDFLAVPVTVENWAQIVRRLHDSGRAFRDGHLGGTAVDVHIKTLPPSWIPLLVEGARRAGGSPTIETNPPHLHVDGFSWVTA